MQLSFHRNVGNVDRAVRVTIGIILIYIALFNPWTLNSLINLIIGLLGTVMIIEGVLTY